MPVVEWLDPEEMLAWRTLLRATAALTAALDAELTAEAGLGLPEYEVLVFLSEAPEHRLRMAELAASVLVSPSGLTRRVDRMVAEGLVARERCPSDRRGTFAVLTHEGRRRLEVAAPVHLRGVRAHFVDHLSRSRLAALADALGAVLADDGAQAGIGTCGAATA